MPRLNLRPLPYPSIQPTQPQPEWARRLGPLAQPQPEALPAHLTRDWQSPILPDPGQDTDPPQPETLASVSEWLRNQSESEPQDTYWRELHARMERNVERNAESGLYQADTSTHLRSDQISEAEAYINPLLSSARRPTILPPQPIPDPVADPVTMYYLHWTGGKWRLEQARVVPVKNRPGQYIAIEESNWFAKGGTYYEGIGRSTDRLKVFKFRKKELVDDLNSNLDGLAELTESLASLKEIE